MRLRTKLTLAFLFVGLLPLGLVTADLVRRHLADLKAGAWAYEAVTADLAVARVQGVMARALADLEGIGAALVRPGSDVDARLAAAQALLVAAPDLSLVTVYGSDGVRLDTMRLPKAASELSPPATLSPEIRGEAASADVVHLALLEAGAARYQPAVATVRVGTPPEVYAYLWAPIALDGLNEVVADVSNRHFAAADRVTLLDEHFSVLAQGDPAVRGASYAGRGLLADMDARGAAMAGAYAQTGEYEADGVGLLGVAVTLPERRWIVLVEQPQSETYRAVRAALVMALVVLGVFVLLAIAAGLLLARRLAAPVSEVARGAAQVAEGDFSVRVDARSADEVGQMGRAFNAMASGLETYRDSLVAETRIRTDLSRYLSPEVVETIVNQEEALHLGGERRTITVMFADVVGFTALSEENDPEFVVGILNELFTIMTEIVFKHGGIVDKFLGDCIMAIFGAPTSQPDDAQRAVRAAEEILRWLEVGNTKWRVELGRDLELAIGINSGEAVVGNIGSEKRMEYTAIGDAVNVAAKLEQMARPGQILMTAETMARIADEFDSVSLGEHGLTGRVRRSEIFALTE